jgi:hypothetical protein
MPLDQASKATQTASKAETLVEPMSDLDLLLQQVDEIVESEDPVVALDTTTGSSWSAPRWSR